MRSADRLGVCIVCLHLVLTSRHGGLYDADSCQPNSRPTVTVERGRGRSRLYEQVWPQLDNGV